MKVIEAGSTSHFHTPRGFSKLHDPVGMFLIGSEMPVTVFRDGMSKRFINCAGSHFAAVNVRDGNLEWDRSQCRSVHFVSVTEDKQHVRLLPGVCRGKTDRPQAHRRRDSGRRVTRERHFHNLGNRNGIPLDFTHCSTKFE